jgi:hypothetical protein
MGVWGPYLQSLYPDSHDVYGPVYSVVLGAIGAALDMVDPAQLDNGLGLKSEFSVATATGAALDRQGADWGITRDPGQSDDAYRAAILASLAIYANGASDVGIALAVKQFTGVTPLIYDGSQDGWIWGSSSLGNNAWGDLTFIFSIFVYVQNPNFVPYSHLALQTTVRNQLPARSRAIIYHNGIDTSSLNQAANAIVTLIG